MPQSIPAGLTRDHVLRTLADLDAGLVHPFGAPTGYELLHDGKRYAPKAVVGMACRYSIGRVLQPGDFSGGESPGQANAMATPRLELPHPRLPLQRERWMAMHPLPPSPATDAPSCDSALAEGFFPEGFFPALLAGLGLAWGGFSGPEAAGRGSAVISKPP